MEPENQPATLTVPAAARLLGIGRSLAYQAVRSGEIPSIRLGQRVMVPKAALQRLLDQRDEPSER